MNGYVSDFFKPSRGVRQGCPLSPLLYVISIEVLACSLRAHPTLSGQQLPHVYCDLPFLSLYADDTSIISSSDVATQAIFSVYGDFARRTGAKLNLDKCEGLRLGSWMGRSDASFWETEISWLPTGDPVLMPSPAAWMPGALAISLLQVRRWSPMLLPYPRCDTWLPSFPFLIGLFLNSIRWWLFWVGLFCRFILLQQLFKRRCHDCKRLLLPAAFVSPICPALSPSLLHYTAEHMVSFGLSVPLPCFCGAPMESAGHLFFYCPLAQSGIHWIQQSLFFACSHMSRVLELRHLSGFSSDEYRSVPQVLGYMHNVCKFFVWTQWNDFRLRSICPSAVGLIASIKVVTFLSPAFRFSQALYLSKAVHSVCLAMGHQWCSRKFP